ncbi:MAG TPA: hypothetical protein PKK15_05905 [Kouleothrix sp.]|nr:hypothetical protein [Kouleothrix sp.]
MSYLIINGTTYSGLPNGTGNQSAWQPTGYVPKIEKIGTTLVAADGTHNRVERASPKRAWKIDWDGCNNATRLALATLAALGSSFSMTDFDGATYTCFIDDPFEPSWAFNDLSGASFWACAITVRQV